ncbi:MAG: glycosyltransferase [Anaerolineaceae bacterium]|nr:glycosyltransferase [Anaerolineaceae bacterium]
MSLLPIRLGLQQRVLPVYRSPFFDALARLCEGGLGLFTGQPRPEEMIAVEEKMEAARLWPARNVHLFHGRYYLCWQIGWRRWLADWQPDALILEANPRYLHVPRMARWMTTRGRPVVGWGLGAPMNNGALSKWRDHLRRNFLSNFDAMITYSSKGAEEYHRVGFPQERIFIAPNAAAPRPAWPLPERPLDFFQKAVVLFVGRLQARKRVDLLIEACAVLPAELQPQLWVVGAGPQQASLEALAKQRYPETRFWGACYGDALAAVFRQADLFVLPGTGGLAVQEAMAYGLPVVVGEADGTQTELVRPENGWVLPPGDLQALTKILTQALASPSRLREMGKRSYEIVSDEINLEYMVDIFKTALNFVMRRV